MAIKSWTRPSFVASTATDLVVPAANKEVSVVGLILFNNEAANSAFVTVSLTSSANVFKGTIWAGLLLPGEGLHHDTKVFLAASATPDKLRVVSDQDSVSIIASGDESLVDGS